MEHVNREAIQDELAALRAELEALRAERGAAPDGAADQDEESDEDQDLKADLRELAEVVDRELKDSNPVTLIAVFALGAFVGRLLPR